MTPATILRERAARLCRKAGYVVRQYAGREGDDAWSWLLGTANDLEQAAAELDVLAAAPAPGAG